MILCPSVRVKKFNRPLRFSENSKPFGKKFHKTAGGGVKFFESHCTHANTAQARTHFSRLFPDHFQLPRLSQVFQIFQVGDHPKTTANDSEVVLIQVARQISQTAKVNGRWPSITKYHVSITNRKPFLNHC